MTLIEAYPDDIEPEQRNGRLTTVDKLQKEAEGEPQATGGEPKDDIVVGPTVYPDGMVPSFPVGTDEDLSEKRSSIVPHELVGPSEEDPYGVARRGKQPFQ